MLKKIGIRNVLIGIVLMSVVYFTFIYKVSVDTQRAIYTVYEDKTHFEGIYFANEKIIYKDNLEKLGKLNIKNGERVSIGTKIADTLTGDMVGVLVYSLDGYENSYNLKNIKSVELKDIKSVLKNENTSPGLKIMETETAYLYVYTEEDGNFSKGQKYYISIDGKKYLTSVEDMVGKKQGNFMVLKLIEDIDFKDLHRGVTGDIIKSSHKGILIKSNAITVKGKSYNIFVKSANGYASVKTVDVLYDDGKNAVVIPKGRDTIQEHDEIVINPPKSLKDGSRVK